MNDNPDSTIQTLRELGELFKEYPIMRETVIFCFGLMIREVIEVFNILLDGLRLLIFKDRRRRKAEDRYHESANK